MTVRHKLIGASMLALLTAGAASAQTAQATDPAPDDTIVVTGYGASLQASIEAKRKLNVIADVITAEDIGKFPDHNVAESLQRVPGIVINRDFGEGERVSLRGTAPNLTQTLLNGSHIATADWFVLEQQSATRSFNYLMLPSDIVARLEVYKSPTAALEEGGIGGAINVITRKPLDLDAFSFSASAQAVYSDRSKKTNADGSILLSWHNADNTFGVLAAGVYQRRDIRRDGIEVLGYFAPPASALPAGTPAGTLAPSLIGSALFQQERERIGGNATIQFKPSDQFEVNLTGLYSRFNADNFNENYLAWTTQALNGGGTLTNGTIADNTFVKGTVNSTPTGRGVVYDAIDRIAKTITRSIDLDVNWHPSESSLLHVKGGWTKADGDTDSQPFFEAGAPGGFTYDLTGKAPAVSFIGVNPTRPQDMVFDFASLHKITSEDKEKYVYADFTQDFDAGPLQAISIGGKFTDHDRVNTFLATTYGGFFVPLSTTGCGGGVCTPASFAGGPLPSDYLKNIAAPGSLTQYYSIDRNKLESIFFGLPASARARIILPGSNFAVNEKTYGGYAMAKVGGDGWGGNFGVRVIRTDQSSSGQTTGVPATAPGAVPNLFGPYIPVTVDRSYTDVLPSLNLSFDINAKLKLRVAAARTVARPDYTDIVPGVVLNPGARTGTSGNPFVDPYRANQFDASFEWNAGRRTFAALAIYYKDILSYIVNRSVANQIYPIELAPAQAGGCTAAGAGSSPGSALYNCPFSIDVRSNGGGGRNIGFEFQAQHTMENGFGASVNYTYSNARSDAGDPIPGNSKHSFNVTGFYENELFAARLSYNYRSAFFINIDRAAALNQDTTASLDASLSVNLTKQVSLTADAVNLTNVKIRQFAGTRSLPRAIYDNGRQFYVGARFKF